jgi:hypothetical protein
VKVRVASAVLETLERCAYIVSVYILYRTVTRYHLRTRTRAKPVSSKPILSWIMTGENDAKSRKSRKNEARKLDETGKKRRKRSEHNDDRRNSSSSVGKSAALVQNSGTIPSQKSSTPACITDRKPTTNEVLEDQTRQDIVDFFNATIEKLLKKIEELENALALNRQSIGLGVEQV